MPNEKVTIKKRKLEYFGHAMKGQKCAFLQLIIQGRIQRKQSVDKRRLP